MKLCRVWLVCLLASSCVNLAVSEDITFNYQGEEINTLSGGTIVGTLVFDSNISDSLPSDPSIARYDGAASWTGQITGGELDGFAFSFDGGDIIVFNDLNGTLDQLTVNFFDLGLQSGILFNDVDGTAFNSDGLPIGFDLDDFEPSGLQIESADFGLAQNLTGFNITSISAIPEPSIGFLASCGLFVIASNRHRRKSSI